MIKSRMEEERKKAPLEIKKPEKKHINLAKELMDKQQYEVALVQLNAAEKKEGRIPEIYHLMGVCYYAIQEYEKAIESFSRAIDINRDFSFAYNSLGMTYALMYQTEKAREFFLKAISLNPARADFYNNIGFLDMKSRRYENAEYYFRKSLSVNRDFRRARNNLAICLGLRGKDKEAMDILISNYPRPVALKNMGAIYQMKGENEKAEAIIREAAASSISIETTREPPEIGSKRPSANTQEVSAGEDKVRSGNRANPVHSASRELLEEPMDIGDWLRVEVDNWAIVDEGEKEGPSSWYISDKILKQKSNIHGGSHLGDIPDKPGTYAVAGENLWADYCLEVDLRSSDDDALGIIFRYLDSNNYYRFSMDSSREYRRLVKKSNGRIVVLAEENTGYEKDRNYLVRIIAVKERLRIYLDEELLFDVRDQSISRGKVGLYCWENADSEFIYPIVRLFYPM
jgi:Flp pilus assembly protein TadD